MSIDYSKLITPEMILAQKKAAFDDAVTIERDRRMAKGFTFSWKTFQSRSTDREAILGNATLVFTAVAGDAEAGDLRWADSASDFNWIAMDNTLVPMDASTMLAFAKAAAAHKAMSIFKAREIKYIVP